ncbi:MAG: DMT family transporter [Spirochaetaceae bacterium]|jgi:drug/metabolite transporter (DMT)-like permease|nr:DMT family transporter [Spirochaetaceae bacterium]
MQRNNSPRAGQGAVLLCAVLWSTSGLFIKLMTWHPMVIAGLRSLVAAVFMLAFRLVVPRRGRGTHQPFPLIAGALAYAFTMILFVIANKLTASANAILLQYSAPVWAALLGWALIREKPRWEHWLALGMVMGGLFLFFKDGLAGGSLLGDSLAVLSGIFFGANSVFMRMQKKGNPADTMLLSHIIAAAICLPFAGIYPPAFSPLNILIILFMGIIQIGCASLLFAYGIKRISAIQAMLTAMVEPILNPLWVLLATGEKPSPSALVGGGIIVLAVLIPSLVGKGRA